MQTRKWKPKINTTEKGDKMNLESNTGKSLEESLTPC